MKGCRTLVTITGLFLLGTVSTVHASVILGISIQGQAPSQPQTSNYIDVSGTYGNATIGIFKIEPSITTNPAPPPANLARLEAIEGTDTVNNQANLVNAKITLQTCSAPPCTVTIHALATFSGGPSGTVTFVNSYSGNFWNGAGGIETGCSMALDESIIQDTTTPLPHMNTPCQTGSAGWVSWLNQPTPVSLHSGARVHDYTAIMTLAATNDHVEFPGDSTSGLGVYGYLPPDHNFLVHARELMKKFQERVMKEMAPFAEKNLKEQMKKAGIHGSTAGFFKERDQPK